MQDKLDGKLASVWSSVLQSSEVSTVDASPAIMEPLHVKDKDEVTNSKRAAFLAARVMKDFLVPKLECELPSDWTTFLTLTSAHGHHQMLMVL